MCASPQKENGYIPIANEIAERFCETKHRISGDEWTILWIILRKTYGWNKPEDAIPLSQFTEISGMKRQNVHRALKKLSSKKMIAVIKNDDRQPLSISFQKDYEKWVLSSKKITVIKNDDRPVIKIDSNLSSKLIPSKDNTKYNIKTRKFIPPTLDEVKNYCLERKNGIDAEAFINHYETGAWIRGKTPIRNWKACVRTWEKNKPHSALVNRKAGWTPEEWAAAEKAKDENYLAGKAKA